MLTYHNKFKLGVLFNEPSLLLMRTTNLFTSWRGGT